MLSPRSRRIARIAATVALIALVAFVAWRGLQTGGGASTDLHGFRLTESAERHGLAFRHRSPIVDSKIANVGPHVAGVGAAVSVADVDNDGFSDVYAVTSCFGERNALFRNRGDGSFDDVAAAAGVADLNAPGLGASMGSLFGDVDNDGFEDLLVYKWGFPQLFLNRGDLTFRDVTEEAGLRRFMNCNAAVLFDLHRDGLLDLYFGGYFREETVLWDLATTRIMQNSFEFAENAGHNVLFRNRGAADGSVAFEDVTERMDADSTRWTFAIAAADFDHDGWQDLYLANDYGTEELLLNRGGERFERPGRLGLEDDSKSGMSVALGDFENRGRLGVYVTNITRAGFLFQGNNLRRNLLADEGRFEEIAEGIVADCGWAWGAQFGDLDNDGWQDLFVVNGFVSADPEQSYWYGMSKVASAVSDIFEDAAKWEPIGTKSLSGYERSRVLLNRGGRAFRDVAADVGVTDLLDGRAVAFADLFNRGVLDALIANQNQPLLLYENDVEPGRHWAQFRLEGTQSNRSAIGARVTIEFGGHVQSQVVAAGSGFAAQNDRRLHFGLGAAERIDRARIAWPSGATQTLEGLAADRLHQVVEPRDRAAPGGDSHR